MSDIINGRENIDTPTALCGAFTHRFDQQTASDTFTKTNSSQTRPAHQPLTVRHRERRYVHEIPELRVLLRMQNMIDIGCHDVMQSRLGYEILDQLESLITGHII